MKPRDRKKLLWLRPSSNQPSKAELEEDMSIDASPEGLARAILRQIEMPELTMSTDAMIACAPNEIVLGKHSSLGPTDPQIFIPTSLGVRFVPARAVLDQFDMARKECVGPGKLPDWLPMLGQFGSD
jgi:hypothetical protein